MQSFRVCYFDNVLAGNNHSKAVKYLKINYEHAEFCYWVILLGHIGMNKFRFNLNEGTSLTEMWYMVRLVSVYFMSTFVKLWSETEI